MAGIPWRGAVIFGSCFGGIAELNHRLSSLIHSGLDNPGVGVLRMRAGIYNQFASNPGAGGIL